MSVDARRREIKEFLRARREAISPEMVGIVRGQRRLAPGLRREEVAALAGVGLTWFTWLEQGRDINVSADALTRIARALRLSPADQHYLFTLAGVPLPPIQAASFQLTPALASVMGAYEGPVTILDPVFNVLATNALADLVYDFEHCVEPFSRNQIWQLFFNRRRRALYLDPTDIMNFVALFRLTARTRIGSADYENLLAALTSRSAEFSAIWNAREVAAPIPRTVSLRHSALHDIKVNSVRIPLAESDDAMIVFLGPADRQTAKAFAQARAWINKEHPESCQAWAL